MNRYKVAIVMISLNEPYWQYVKPCIDSLRRFFLKGHDLDFILWTDMPKEMGNEMGAKIVPTEPHKWPTPTLMRYHLFLREEALLSEYDFIYYVDADMAAVTKIGDEVIGDIVGAVHPMYYIRSEYNPPYEPNKDSTAYIPRSGRIIETDGKKRLQPLYFAGGFQGGRADLFIKAMKVLKDMIDKDFMENNYVAIWNDESYWNRYLFENPPTVVLNPSYVYPDTLVNTYYRKAWGRNFVPKLVTITKKFSLSKQAGNNLKQTIQNL